ncbi:MAG: AAA family ATPase [Myxococcota bacterium]
MSSAPAERAGATPPNALVGREGELLACRSWLADVETGTRRIAFLTGEPGIGKTALVEAFVDSLRDEARVRVAIGQCVELYGAAEPYLPWLDALGALARRVDGAQVVEILRRVAPLWLAQLPAFVGPDERRTLLQEAADAPPQRMFRELADALALLAAERPLVVVLEDLHWADRPSLELLAWIARRREPAKLVMVGTYRPWEMGRAEPPLRSIAQDLLAQRRAERLELGDLSAAAVREMLAARFPGLPPDFADLIHRRTDGHPLFLLNTLEDLQRRDLIGLHGGLWEIRGDAGEIETAVPDSLRTMIGSQLERLDPAQRRVLEIASVAGIEFCDASLAPALGAGVEEVGARCIELTRQSVFLADAGELDWPDGTPTRRFVFRHALYPEVLYDGLPPSRRMQIHRQLAERLEAGHTGSTDAIAAELATHFERGRDPRRAVVYLAAAARNASRRQAFEEAIASLRRAARLLDGLPDDAERRRQELAIRMALAPMLMITRGYAAPEAEAEYARAEQLCRLGAEDREIFSALLGRSGPALLMARTELARDLAEESLRLAKRRGALRYLAHAESSVGITTFWRGELAYATEHLEAGRAAYAAIDRMPANAWLAHDPGAAGRAYAAWAYWLLGRADRARDESREAIALARSLHHPFSLAFALAFGTFGHQARRDVAATLAHAEATIETCAEYGFAMYHAVGTVFSGWGRAQQGDVDGGIATMEAAIDAYHATGANLVQPYFRALLAETCWRQDRLEPARALLENALDAAERTGELVYLPELHRLLAEVERREAELDGSLERLGPRIEARLLDALALARAQRSAGLGLRVATSLTRLLAARERPDEAARVLAEARSRIEEGFDTPDCVDAAALADELARELASERGRRPRSG